MANNYIDLPVEGGGGGSGITSINSDTTAAQLIVAASTGTDFTIATSGGTTTVAIPSASAANRGLITTGVQTIAGAKTFSSTIVGSINGNAATVTTNANLTGPITSVGNATSIAAQTGTGSTIVVDTSPTLVTPVIGAATGTSLSVSGQLTSTVATGTAPLVVSSTTQVANLNAATAGSATTATTATNATNVATTQVSNNASYFPLMAASSTNGNQAADLGTGLTFNPSTNTLAATTFSGNATTSTTATNIAAGAGGSIPYQSAAGTTAMLSNGTAGQMLVSSGGTAAPTWVTPPFDPTKTFSLFEDFATGFEGPGTGQINGDFTWASVQTGSPTLIMGGTTNIPSDANHPGILVFGTAAGTTTGASITTGIFNSTVNSSFVLGGGQVSFEALINIPVLSNGTDDASLYVGLRTGVGNAALTNGIEISYVHATSVNWICRSAKASTITSTTSSTAVTTGWHHVKVVSDAAGANITYFVDGVLLTTISSNIPTVNIQPVISWYKTAGTTTMYMGIDYMKIDSTFTTPR